MRVFRLLEVGEELLRELSQVLAVLVVVCLKKNRAEDAFAERRVPGPSRLSVRYQIFPGPVGKLPISPWKMHRSTLAR